MRKPLVAGNWKMNGTRESAAELLRALVQGLEDGATAEVLVCPPFVHLADAQRLLRESDIRLGAQSLCAEDAGAFTGEISGAMLRDYDCSYVIVGHSERRSLYHEDDALVARKFMAALRNELVPVLCVGEALEERESGTTVEVIRRQLTAILNAAGIDAFANAVIAYEPVWAIGTGRTASPDQAQEVHREIRDILAAENVTIADSIRLLY